jgi:enoyl-CoA hydratase/carnithine racemase
MRQGKFTGFELTAHDPGIALIQFNEPARLNGMTQAMKRDLVETLLQAQMDDSVRVVVFTGSGRAFSAGDDISGRHAARAGRASDSPRSIPATTPRSARTEAARAVSAPEPAVLQPDKLSVAARTAWRSRPGSRSRLRDFRIAAESARAGSATLRFGLRPRGGQYLLVQHLGVAARSTS